MPSKLLLQSIPSVPPLPPATMRLVMNGPNGSTTFPDTGLYTYAIQNGGVVTNSNVQSKYGTTSGAFPATAGSWLGISGGSSPNLIIGTSDFTVGMWAYFTAWTPYVDPGVYTCLFDLRTNGGTQGLLCGLTAPDGSNNARMMMLGTNVQIQAINFDIPLNTWTYLCWMRASSVLYFFVNGNPVSKQIVNGFDATGGNLGTSTPTIGSSTERSPAFPRVNGYMNDFRFYNGTAVYTTTGFTPPSTP